MAKMDQPHEVGEFMEIPQRVINEIAQFFYEKGVFQEIYNEHRSEWTQEIIEDKQNEVNNG